MKNKRKRSGYSRRGRDDIAVFKRIVEFLSSDEATGVCDIGHQPGAFLLRYLLQPCIVPITWICRGTTDDQTGLEEIGLNGEFGVIDEVSCWVERVWEGLEIDRRC
jgi:hypothetical protein